MKIEEVETNSGKALFWSRNQDLGANLGPQRWGWSQRCRIDSGVPGTSPAPRVGFRRDPDASGPPASSGASLGSSVRCISLASRGPDSAVWPAKLVPQTQARFHWLAVFRTPQRRGRWAGTPGLRMGNTGPHWCAGLLCITLRAFPGCSCLFLTVTAGHGSCCRRPRTALGLPGAPAGGWAGSGTLGGALRRWSRCGPAQRSVHGPSALPVRTAPTLSTGRKEAPCQVAHHLGLLLIAFFIQLEMPTSCVSFRLSGLRVPGAQGCLSGAGRRVSWGGRRGPTAHTAVWTGPGFIPVAGGPVGPAGGRWAFARARRCGRGWDSHSSSSTTPAGDDAPGESRGLSAAEGTG